MSGTEFARVSAEKVVQRFHAVGRVQGVGFRWFVRETARTLGVSGWVKNEDDGSVAAIATGTTAQLRLLEDAIRHGPPGALVRHVDVHQLPAGESTSAGSRVGGPDATSLPFQVIRS